MKALQIGINLKEEDRQEADVSVGASGEWRGEVGLYGCPSGDVMVVLDVSRSTRQTGYLSPRQGHHKGLYLSPRQDAYPPCNRPRPYGWAGS